MGTPQFPDLGKHCAVDVCKQNDFLPFTCDRCLQVLCLDHRSYMKHDCPKGNRGDVTVVICPFCATAVRLNPDEVPNVAWEEHVNSVCDHSNDEKALKKNKKICPVPKCGAVLTFSYTIKCRDCDIDHCLKHRFGPEHSCSGPKKPADSSFSSENKKVATSAPASSTSSSSRSSSLLASLEARIRKKRLNTTRVRGDSRFNRTRVGGDSSVVRAPLWMMREGLVLTREERGEISQEEEAAKLKDCKDAYLKAYHNFLLKQKGMLNQPESSGFIQSVTTSSDLQVGMKSKRELEDKVDDVE